MHICVHTIQMMTNHSHMTFITGLHNITINATIITRTHSENEIEDEMYWVGKKNIHRLSWLWWLVAMAMFTTEYERKPRDSSKERVILCMSIEIEMKTDTNVDPSMYDYNDIAISKVKVKYFICIVRSNSSSHWYFFRVFSGVRVFVFFSAVYFVSSLASRFWFGLHEKYAHIHKLFRLFDAHSVIIVDKMLRWLRCLCIVSSPHFQRLKNFFSPATQRSYVGIVNNLAIWVRYWEWKGKHEKATYTWQNI